MTKEEFTRQLADLVGLEAGSDDLTAAHEKLAVAVQAPLYSEKILVAARKLASLRIHSDRFRDALSDAVYEGRALPSQRQDLARYLPATRRARSRWSARFTPCVRWTPGRGPLRASTPRATTSTGASRPSRPSTTSRT